MTASGRGISAETALPDRVLLDTCCVLNLYATKRMEEILGGVASRFAVAERVVAESIYVEEEHPGRGLGATRVELAPFIQSRMLDVMRIETDAEAASFVTFAADLDDGEAMTCALAVQRGWAVATDDRKALRILQMRAPWVAVCSTTALVRAWAETGQVPVLQVKQVLADITGRARFTPGRHDAQYTWWHTILRSQ